MKVVSLSDPPSNYVLSPSLRPQFWFPPSRVWEIRGADFTLSTKHTSGRGLIDGYSERGISMRFPRFIRERSSEDKSPENATTPDEILD
eukprot:Awhi_evm1s5924